MFAIIVWTNNRGSVYVRALYVMGGILKTIKVYMYSCIGVCEYVCMFIYIYIYVCVCVCVCIHWVCLCADMYVHFVWVVTFKMCVCVCVCVFIYVLFTTKHSRCVCECVSVRVCSLITKPCHQLSIPRWEPSHTDVTLCYPYNMWPGYINPL